MTQTASNSASGRPQTALRTDVRDAGLRAARDRVAAVPTGTTLIEQIDADLWHTGEDGPVEAGASRAGPAYTG